MPGSTPGVYVCVLNNYPCQVGTFLVHMDYAAGWRDSLFTQRTMVTM